MQGTVVAASLGVVVRLNEAINKTLAKESVREALAKSRRNQPVDFQRSLTRTSSLSPRTGAKS